MLKELNSANLEALFQYADADADGMLNLLEFCELLHEMRLGLDTDSLIELFMLLGQSWAFDGHCWAMLNCRGKCKCIQAAMHTLPANLHKERQ